MNCFPEILSNIFFLDDHFNDAYKAQISGSGKYLLFSPVSLSSLPRLGLFDSHLSPPCKKQKEIGIRKVLGASVGNILNLLYREFAGLLAISFFITVPLAWLSSNSWLQNYSFRIGMHWIYFILPFLLIVLIIDDGQLSVRQSSPGPIRLRHGPNKWMPPTQHGLIIVDFV